MKHPMCLCSKCWSADREMSFLYVVSDIMLCQIRYPLDSVLARTCRAPPGVYEDWT